MAMLTTDTLEIDYRDEGPRGGPAVLLLHGWPDDPTTFDGVLPRLHKAGFRTIVPSLRGFGNTRFRDPRSPRTGNSGVLALDAIALMDGLEIGAFHVVGHDWGSNAGEALAVGWPDRVGRLALLASPPRLGGMPTPPFWHAQLEWYHWFMATARGAEAVKADPKGFAHRHWVNWGPPGWFDEATFERVAKSWDNPDFVPVTLHSYRARWDEADPDPASAWLEEKVKATRTLSLPAKYFQGETDGVNPPAANAQVPAKFSGPFELVSVPGVGHFIQREAAETVAIKLVELFTAHESGLVEKAVGKVTGVVRAVTG